MPSGIEAYGAELFSGCILLTTVSLGNLKEGADVFGDNQSIKKVIFNGGLEEGYFPSSFAVATVVFGGGVISIPKWTFGGHPYLTYVEIGDTVTEIGQETFAECGALKTVVIGDGLKQLAECAFMRCESLENITLGASLEIIDRCAFSECPALKSIECPESLKIIKEYAFSDSYGLKSIYLPAGTAFIGDGAFLCCSSLGTITFGGTVEQWRAIEKGYGWDEDTANYVVYCTDGQVAKDGTVTYK